MKHFLLLGLGIVALSSCGPSPKKKAEWEDLGSTNNPSLTPEQRENQRREWERNCRGRPGGYLNGSGVCIYTSGQIVFKRDEKKENVKDNTLEEMQVRDLGSVHSGAAIYSMHTKDITTGQALIQVDDKTIANTPFPLTALPAGRLKVVLMAGYYEGFGLWVYQCYTQTEGSVPCPLFASNPPLKP